MDCSRDRREDSLDKVVIEQEMMFGGVMASTLILMSTYTGAISGATYEVGQTWIYNNLAKSSLLWRRNSLKTEWPRQVTLEKVTVAPGILACYKAEYTLGKELVTTKW